MLERYKKVTQKEQHDCFVTIHSIIITIYRFIKINIFMKINKDKDGVLPWTVDQVALGQAIVFW